MIETLTRKPLFKKAVEQGRGFRDFVSERMSGGGRKGIALKAFAGLFCAALGWIFVGTMLDYGEASALAAAEGSPQSDGQLPSVVPLAWQAVGVLLALAGFVVSLFLKEEFHFESRRGDRVVLVLWLLAGAALAAWLPSDVIATQEAVSGKALAGETPSIPAYLGGLFVVSLLIVSIPVASMVYFRLGLMDRYLVNSFLSPFLFCLCSFMAIWIIGDLTDNGNWLMGFSLGELFLFYAAQIPYVVLFVMPIAMLLSGLFALSKMSKSNEFISMIGAGRSVVRVLAPLFIVGAHFTLICVALKYEWAPSAVGYKEAVLQAAKEREWAARHGNVRRRELWAKRGWMHVNEVGHRTWFVGRVPLDLSNAMGDVVVWQLDAESQPVEVYTARWGQWFVEEDGSRWEFTNVKVYRYGEDGIPTIEAHRTYEIVDWSETPWKVLSSSQDPEFLGLPGLTMYLNAHADLDGKSLAPFRTNWWYIFAEPFIGLALLIVAAPLGIVYSRRASMAGVTGAIVVFAFMYVMRGTTLPLGHRGVLSPFLAAWSTNFVVAAIGLSLLWFRARNREIPRLGDCVKALFARRSAAGVRA